MRSSIKSPIKASKSQRPRLAKEQISQVLYKLKKIKYPVRPISNAIMIKKKISSFSEQVAFQLKRSISQKLNAYRQVRGDGNCFFRAFAFSFIANRSSTQFSQIFSSFEEISFDCCYLQTIPKQFKQFYSDTILRSVLYSTWSKQYEFHYKQNGRNYRRALSKMLNQNHYLDFIIILYFRSLCFYALDKKKEQYKEFLSGKNEQQNIRSYGTESQGLIFQLCSKFLNININIFEIRKNQVVAYNYRTLRGQSQTKNEVDLLFYDKHYDLFQENQQPLAEFEDQYELQSRYSRISNNLIKGECIQCGKKGEIGQQTGICLDCFNQSIKNFDIYQKDRQIVGICGQCKRKTSNLSQQLKICQDCLKKIQSDSYQNNSKINSHSKKYLCEICKRQSSYLDYNKICQQCSNRKKSPSKNDSMHLSQKLKKCRDCRQQKKQRQIDQRTDLCKQCDAFLMNNSNVSKQSKQSQICKKCGGKKMAQLNPYGICYQCFERQNEKKKSPMKMTNVSYLGGSSLRNEGISQKNKNQSAISLQFSSLQGKQQSKIKKQALSPSKNTYVMNAQIFGQTTRKCQYQLCNNKLQGNNGIYCKDCLLKIEKQKQKQQSGKNKCKQCQRSFAGNHSSYRYMSNLCDYCLKKPSRK